MARKHKDTTGPGRPPGGGRSAETVVIEPSKCPKCDHTERSNYRNTVIQDFAGILPDGRRYHRIIRRRTECLNCHQARIDKTYE